MAHELNFTNGKASMFYAGEAPWHGLGTRLDRPATAAEAIEAAGLGWTAEKVHIYTAENTEIKGKRAIIRSDTRAPLGIVGARYAPIQNRECFNFLDSMAAEGRVMYHTAGALGAGERVWMLAKLPDDIRVAGTDDITEKYLLLSNSHDGGSSMRVYFTPVRVVCANTLAAAAAGRDATRGVIIRHSGNVMEKVEQAREILGLADAYYADIAAKINAMAGRQISVTQLQTFFKEIYPDPTDVKKPAHAQAVRATLAGLFEGGRGQDLPGVKGTLWAAVNAVTEWVDHYQPVKAGATADSRRLDRIWFGDGALLKARAWDTALATLAG